MKKGDLRKTQILDTAEALFCTKGYEASGIQDILDILHTSKGSFYHHYISKESVLEALCLRHAKAASEACEEQLSALTKPFERLNLIFSSLIPLQEKEMTFLLMMLPVFNLPEGRTVKLCWQESLSTCFLPMAETQLQEMKKGGLILPAAEGYAPLCLALVNRCWTQLVSALIRDAKNAARTDASALLDILDLYRRSLERILNAPYGSLVLCDLQGMKLLTDRILRNLH